MNSRIVVLVLTLVALTWVWFAFGAPAVGLFLAFLSVPALTLGGLSLLSLATR